MVLHNSITAHQLRLFSHYIGRSPCCTTIATRSPVLQTDFRNYLRLSLLSLPLDTLCYLQVSAESVSALRGVNPVRKLRGYLLQMAGASPAVASSRLVNSLTFQSEASVCALRLQTLRGRRAPTKTDWESPGLLSMLGMVDTWVGKLPIDDHRFPCQLQFANSGGGWRLEHAHDTNAGPQVKPHSLAPTRLFALFVARVAQSDR
jgi:hypothetical protein